MTQKKKKESREKQLQRFRKVKRRRGKSKKYFHEVHENAIAQYVRSSDKEERHKLYETIIRPGLAEIVENIVNTFKFHYLPDLEDKKGDCLSNIYEKLDMFDPDRGFKAFSYFSIAIKHWFIIEAKKFGKRNNIHVYIDDLFGNYQEFNKHIDNFTSPNPVIFLERMEYVEQFTEDITKWAKSVRSGTNLWAVYEAVLSLFNDLDSLESTKIDRAAVYEYIHQETGLKNSQISNALYRLRKKYKNFNKQYY